MDIIEGKIVLEYPVSVKPSTVVRVRILDVSRADASSDMIAQSELTDLDITEEQQEIPFRLEVANLTDDKSYAFWTHVDLNGNGLVEKEDFITQEHYKLEPTRFLSSYRIEVKRIE